MRLPYLTLEIRTDDLKHLIPWQDTHPISTLTSISSTYVGPYVGTLHSLCQMADDVVTEMQNYDLLTSNCQTFCNKLLKKMGIQEYPTTYQPGMIDDAFDKITEELFTNGCNETSKHAPISTKTAAPPADRSSNLASTNGNVSNGNIMPGISKQTSKLKEWQTGPICSPNKTVKLELKKTARSLSVSDLNFVHKILLPVKDYWKKIGNKLQLHPNMLHQIERIDGKSVGCLREMLRKYLQQSNPPPSWETLAHAVEEHNSAVAQSILRRAEYVSND